MTNSFLIIHNQASGINIKSYNLKNMKTWRSRKRRRLWWQWRWMWWGTLLSLGLQRELDHERLHFHFHPNCRVGVLRCLSCQKEMMHVHTALTWQSSGPSGKRFPTKPFYCCTKWQNFLLDKRQVLKLLIWLNGWILIGQNVVIYFLEYSCFYSRWTLSVFIINLMLKRWTFIAAIISINLKAVNEKI